MYELTLKLIVSDIKIDTVKNIPKWQIATPEQEEEAYLFLQQSKKWGAPWV